MKGDRVEIVIDAGDGVRTFEVAARRAGRRVETETHRGVLEVTELTRTGQAVRSAKFMASRVVAIVEHPAADVVFPGEPGVPPQDAQQRSRAAEWREAS